MPRIDATTGWDDPGRDHELWLAMQAAHSRYKNASAALNALAAMSLDSVVSERDLHIEAAAGVERNAFENYIEARLQLSEWLLSKKNERPMEAGIPEEAGQRQGSGSRISGRVLVTVMAALLFSTAFGLGYLLHVRRQKPDLDATRDEAVSALHQTPKQVETPVRPMQPLKAINQPRARSASATTRLTKTIRGQFAAPSLTSGGRSIARNHQELVQLQKHTERHYREFTLRLWKRSERIGPISLTVLKVNPERKFFDLSISVDNLTPKRRRVNLYEPVWIDWNGRPRALELVVNRMDRYQLQGYLSEPKYPHMAWRGAPPQPGVVVSAKSPSLRTPGPLSR